MKNKNSPNSPKDISSISMATNNGANTHADFWNPNQYEKFKKERAQPFWDLAALVDWTGVHSFADLGCGTGELTTELAIEKKITIAYGIDNSPSMLKKTESVISPVQFKNCDIEKFSLEGKFATDEQKLDLIFSNAALQWVPEHVTLLSNLHHWLRPDGQIAIQMPANFNQPSHSLAELIARDLFPDRGENFIRKIPVLQPEDYSRLLFELGFHNQIVRQQIYPHLLEKSSDVIEWVRGTLLTHYEKVLSPADFQSFLTRYSERLLQELGDETPYLYTFRRTFIWGQK